MQVLNEFNSIFTVGFIVQNSIGLKPSKPILGWNPRFPISSFQTGQIYLAWGADFWDGEPIEPDVNWSELQRKIGSGEWTTIYSGNKRCWSENSSIYLSLISDTIYFRVRVRDNQNFMSSWSGLFNTKMLDYYITSNEEIILNPEIIQPTTFLLFQNYPNPFNPITVISWQSPVGRHQTIKVFDVLGNEIVTLVDEYLPAGRYEIKFDASRLASGVYFYQLRAGSYTAVKKMILIK
jgi:hypothetical protein